MGGDLGLGPAHYTPIKATEIDALPGISEKGKNLLRASRVLATTLGFELHVARATFDGKYRGTMHLPIGHGEPYGGLEIAEEGIVVQDLVSSPRAINGLLAQLTAFDGEHSFFVETRAFALGLQSILDKEEATVTLVSAAHDTYVLNITGQHARISYSVTSDRALNRFRFAAGERGLVPKVLTKQEQALDGIVHAAFKRAYN